MLDFRIVDRRRVLLISYLFPPAGGVGVHRALAYARYLPESGAEVWVLAARNPSTPIMDPALVADIPPATRMYRVFTPELPYAFRDWLWRRLRGPSGARTPVPTHPAAMPGLVARTLRRLATPDPQVVWRPFAVRRACSLIKDHGIGTVLVTVPPFSALGIGIELKRRFPSLYLISDFRDEWLNFYLNLEPADRSTLREDAIWRERAAVEASDLVVAVTPAQCADIARRYPDQPPTKFLCVPNGYDPAVFADFHARPHATDRIVVGFFGTVYRYNSPVPFLDAVDRLPRELAARFETRFYGRVADGQESRLLENRVSTVKIEGFLAYREALLHLEEADFLLLPVDSPTAHAGKLFDYLATGKPILAPTPPDGEIARILWETGAGWSADPSSPEKLTKMILGALDAVREGRFAPVREAVQVYARPRLVRRLAEAASIVAPEC